MRFPPWCRILSCVCLILHIVIKCVLTKELAKERLNVMFVVSDDLRPSLGCYKTPSDIKSFTPNIDRLAGESLLFKNTFVQQAICGPSRASFLTSRRPDTTHVYDNHSYWRKIGGNFTTLPQYFKENGYHVVSTGKIFHPGPASGKSDDMPYSWSQAPYHASTEKYRTAKQCKGSDGKLHENIVCPVDLDEVLEKTLPDIQIAEFASQFLHSVHNGNITQPFFLGLGFHKPHVPLKYPKQYLEMVPLKDVKLAIDPVKPEYMPDIAWNPWADLRKREDVQALNVSFPYGPLPKDYQLLVRQSYYAATAYMDAQLGYVLKTLEDLGLKNNTIISFIGDHGWSLGEHGEWCKYSNFEIATRIPMIMYVPHLTDTSHNSHYTDALVEAVDIFPTIVELAGLPTLITCPYNSSQITTCTEGLSAAPLVFNITMGNVTHWKSAAFSQYPRPSVEPQENSDQPSLADIRYMGYSIRTQDLRLTQWLSFDPDTFKPDWAEVVAGELYNHTSDPHEDNNLYGRTSLRTVQDKLANKLRKGWKNILLHNNKNIY